MEVNIMGILMRKFDNDKFIEAEKWLEEHPEEAAKMDICMTEGFMRIMERNDKYGR